MPKGWQTNKPLEGLGKATYSSRAISLARLRDEGLRFAISILPVELSLIIHPGEIMGMQRQVQLVDAINKPSTI